MKCMGQPLTPLKGRSEGAAKTLETIGLVMMAIVAMLLFATNLYASAQVSPVPDKYRMLLINIYEENELTNLAVVVVGIGLLYAVSRLVPITAKGNRYFAAVVLTVLTAFGIAWALSVNAQAESDGKVLMQIAEKLAAGNLRELGDTENYFHYYLVRFPYQCGLLSCCEALVRVFGMPGALTAARIVNAVLIGAAYLAVVCLSKQLFHDERTTFLTILLLAFCWQPILSCTFIYGLIPSVALYLWGFFFLIRYLQTDQKRWIVPAALLPAMAVYIRSNTWIAILAAAIVLLLHAIGKRRMFPLLAAVILAAAAYPAPRLAQAGYEARIGTDFGSGYPKSYWMAMSLQEGWKATGWHVLSYQAEMESTYYDNMEGMRKRTMRDAQEGLKALWSDPHAVKTYYFEKLVSQWGEPTFLSIWITKSVDAFAEPGRLAQALYTDAFDGAYRFLMNHALQVLYAGFLLCTIALLRRRTVEQLLLPLTATGAILFHLLFEAKSQYVPAYLPLFVLMSAHGITSVFRRSRAGGGETADTQAT